GRSRSSPGRNAAALSNPNRSAGSSNARSPGPAATVASPRTSRGRSPAARPGCGSPASPSYAAVSQELENTHVILSQTLREFAGLFASNYQRTNGLVLANQRNDKERAVAFLQ